MFVRVRKYERQGWRGTLQKVEYVATDIGAIPVGVYSRSHVRGLATHYMAMESVRTPKGPRQKVIASWLDNPSLKGAIAELQENIERAEREAKDFYEQVEREAEKNKGYEYTRKYPIYRRWMDMQCRIKRKKRGLANLELAFSVLGDWVAPG